MSRGPDRHREESCHIGGFIKVIEKGGITYLGGGVGCEGGVGVREVGLKAQDTDGVGAVHLVGQPYVADSSLGARSRGGEPRRCPGTPRKGRQGVERVGERGL